MLKVVGELDLATQPIKVGASFDRRLWAYGGVMLSFEIKNEGRAIHINYDEEGMAILIKALEEVRADGDHMHMRTPSNGGRQLSEKTPWGKEAIGEVILNWVGD